MGISPKAGPTYGPRSRQLPELLEFLDSDLKSGLTASDAKARTEQFGFNEITERAKHPLLKFMKKFWGPSAWMIEGIAALSLILGKHADAYIASGLLLVNAVISLLQETRAQQVVKMLQSKLQIEARVLRDGEWHNIPARELVPGDIVKLRMGDLVLDHRRIARI